ncbi:TadE/TadG family type IV pilus assembly protein [Nocardioides sp. DS6]|uniref:TadE/TadG family type IV pilus assembly protein n=1 Tax=Nocardioides eburneus TaxID=3231482 RepID=A0ABV3T2W6_9ACTN
MRRLRTDERGSISPFVIIVSLVILLLAGLVIDGGRQLNAHGRAIAYAEEAARAGAQEVDVTDPRLDLVPSLALRAAREYCDNAMSNDPQLVRCVPHITAVDGSAGTFHGVSVSTKVESKAILLSMIGRSTLTSGGQALARPISGISGPDTGKLATMPPPSVAPPSAGPVPTAPPSPPEISISPCTTQTPKPPKPSKPSKTKGPKPPKHTKKPTPTPTPTDKPCVTPGIGQ